MKTNLLPILLLAAACGGEEEPPRIPNQPGLPDSGLTCGPSCEDAGSSEPERTGEVTRCLGPSCPRGECGFSNACTGYAGFDALDSTQLCTAATGSKEFCVQYEVQRDDGYVDIYEQVVSCENPTVVKLSCSAGCGYNYAPDDCAVCNDGSGCALD